MRIDFGQSKFKNKETQQKDKVFLDVDQALNAHMIFAGASGVGKTFQLRRVIDEISRNDPSVRFHVLDVHDDLDLGEQRTSTCKFSESSTYGINPLKIDSDPDMGGVRRRLQSFIRALNRTSTKLGSKQESVLSHLLIDLYAAFGFYQNDPNTWRLDYDPRENPQVAKRQITLADLRRYAESRLKMMNTGAGAQALKNLEELNRTVKKLHTQTLKGNEDEIEKLKQKTKDKYNEYIDNIETGEELSDHLKYSGKDVLHSVYERICNLENAGVFRPKKPDFDRSCPVWRYDVSSLPRDEQNLFVDFVSQELFAAARRRGHQDSPRNFLVLDEAQAFVDDDDDNIFNIIAREGRKFGLGLILASQQLGDFPNEILANTASKVILGIDDMFQEATARRLNIDPKRLRYITPQESALIQVKVPAAKSNRFIDVELPNRQRTNEAA